MTSRGSEYTLRLCLPTQLDRTYGYHNTKAIRSKHQKSMRGELQLLVFINCISLVLRAESFQISLACNNANTVFNPQLAILIEVLQKLALRFSM